jgi:hypothetical protein
LDHKPEVRRSSMEIPFAACLPRHKPGPYYRLLQKEFERRQRNFV